jgi:hypothetical protein
MNLLELAGGQRPRLPEQFCGQRELADIVQQASQPDQLELTLLPPEQPRDGQRELGHAIAVTPHPRMPGLHDAGQRDEHGASHSLRAAASLPTPRT